MILLDLVSDPYLQLHSQLPQPIFPRASLRSFLGRLESTLCVGIWCGNRDCQISCFGIFCGSGELFQKVNESSHRNRRSGFIPVKRVENFIDFDILHDVASRGSIFVEKFRLRIYWIRDIVALQDRNQQGLCHVDLIKFVKGMVACRDTWVSITLFITFDILTMHLIGLS